MDWLLRQLRSDKVERHSGWVCSLAGFLVLALTIPADPAVATGNLFEDILVLDFLWAPLVWGQIRRSRVAAVVQLICYLSLSFLDLAGSLTWTSWIFPGLALLQCYVVSSLPIHESLEAPPAITKEWLAKVARGAFYGVRVMSWLGAIFCWALLLCGMFSELVSGASAKPRLQGSPPESASAKKIGRPSDSWIERRPDIDEIRLFRRKIFGCYVVRARYPKPLEISEDLTELGHFGGELFPFPELDAAALTFLGKFLEHNARTEEAFLVASALYESATLSAPKFLPALLAWGTLETERLDFERAFPPLDEALEAYPTDTDALLAGAKYEFARRDYSESLSALLKIAEASPRVPEVYYYSGLLRRLGGRSNFYSEKHSFDVAYLLDPRNDRAFIESARSMAKNYDSYYVASELEKQRGSELSKMPLVLWATGEAHAVGKRCGVAIPYLRMALIFGVTDTEARLALARCLVTVGKPSEALSVYREAAARDLLHKEAVLAADELLFRLGRLEEARAGVTELVKDRPRYPGAFRLLSRIESALGDRESAEWATRIEAQSHPLEGAATVERAGAPASPASVDDKRLLARRKKERRPAMTIFTYAHFRYGKCIAARKP